VRRVAVTRAGAVDNHRVDVTWLALLIAAVAAGLLAWLSAVAGFGGAVLLLPVFTALFGIRVAVPVLTLTQIASNGGRVWFNRGDINWRLVGWFAIGAVPSAVFGGLLLAKAPLTALKRVLGVFLLGVVAWRHLGRPPRAPHERTFIVVGAASGFGSALLGSVGPLTAPFFLAYGLSKGAYIGTEAASALVMHGAKLVAYGAGNLLTWQVLALGLSLTPTTLIGAWAGKKTVDRLHENVFVTLVEVGLVVAGLLFVFGIA